MPCTMQKVVVCTAALLASMNCVLIDAALPASCKLRMSTSSSKIVGGTSTSAREFPFMVSLQDGMHVCGGSLISATHVLTAAHCGQIPQVVIGAHNIDSSDQCVETISVKRRIVHPNYDGDVTNDIAILELSRPSEYTPVQLMTEALSAQWESTGSVYTVVGWGALGSGEPSSILQKVNVPIYDQSQCNAAYSDILPTMICAGFSQGGKDSCQGDSGGPLFRAYNGYWLQSGIVSFGEGCAQPNRPGVYTRISKFNSWICSTAGVVCGSGGGGGGVQPTIAVTPTPKPTPMPTINNPPTMVAPQPPSGDLDDYYYNVMAGYSGYWNYGSDDGYNNDNYHYSDSYYGDHEQSDYGPAHSDSYHYGDYEQSDYGPAHSDSYHYGDHEGSAHSDSYHYGDYEQSDYGPAHSDSYHHGDLEPTIPTSNPDSDSYDGATSNPDSTNTFDWGSDCEAGRGSFSKTIPTRLDSHTVGTIPKGKFNVKVFLKATSDLDINLYDLSDKSKYPEGQAVVNFCLDTSNCGVLGSSAKPEEKVYKNMRIRYSGFEGDGQNKGNEYIEIIGETSIDLEMTVFSYETGSAEVTYSWDTSNSACCLGTGPCTGTFSLPISQGESTFLGDIPQGINNVFIQLTCDGDVDIQLYDLESGRAGNSRDGTAIVAWCMEVGCGVLGKDPEAKTVPYKGTMITYSGFRGDGVHPGNEFIKVEGTTPVPMRMKAFGYASGIAKVDYTYYRPRR